MSPHRPKRESPAQSARAKRWIVQSPITIAETPRAGFTNVDRAAVPRRVIPGERARVEYEFYHKCETESKGREGCLTLVASPSPSVGRLAIGV